MHRRSYKRKEKERMLMFRPPILLRPAISCIILFVRIQLGRQAGQTSDRCFRDERSRTKTRLLGGGWSKRGERAGSLEVRLMSSLSLCQD